MYADRYMQQEYPAGVCEGVCRRRRGHRRRVAGIRTFIRLRTVSGCVCKGRQSFIRHSAARPKSRQLYRLPRLLQCVRVYACASAFAVAQSKGFSEFFLALYNVHTSVHL